MRVFNHVLISAFVTALVPISGCSGSKQTEASSQGGSANSGECDGMELLVKMVEYNPFGQEVRCTWGRCASQVSDCEKNALCRLGLYVTLRCRDAAEAGCVQRMMSDCLSRLDGYDACSASCPDENSKLGCMSQCLGLRTAAMPVLECVQEKDEECDD